MGHTQRVREGEICSHEDLGMVPGFVPVWSQASRFTSLSLNFLPYKMGIIVVLAYQVTVRAKWDGVYTQHPHRAQRRAVRKHSDGDPIH